MNRRALAAWVSTGMLLLSLAGCGAADRVLHRENAHAISAGGPQDPEYTVEHGRVGGIYGFAFPPLVNRTDQRVELDSVSLKSQTASALVLKYAALNYGETGHQYIPASKVGVKPAVGDYQKYPNHSFDEHLILAPHKLSNWYPIVYVRAKALPVRLSGCVVNFSIDGVRYSQELSCVFEVGRS